MTPEAKSDLWFALSLPLNYDNPSLHYLGCLNKTTLNKVARHRGIPFSKDTKTKLIMDIIAGTFLGREIVEASVLSASALAQNWPDQHQRMLDRTRNNPQIVNRINHANTNHGVFFDPFPEGVDHDYPNKCHSYWLPISDAVVREGISLYSFHIALEYLIDPQSMLSEGMLLRHEIIVKCAYCNKHAQ
jgi:hypothetical protein